MRVVVRRYIDILTIIITPLVLALFLAAASLLLCSFLKCFFGFYRLYNNEKRSSANPRRNLTQVLEY